MSVILKHKDRFGHVYIISKTARNKFHAMSLAVKYVR
jgi:hypothetical protein